MLPSLFVGTATSAGNLPAALRHVNVVPEFTTWAAGASAGGVVGPDYVVLVQGLDGLVVGLRVGFAAVRGDVEEDWCVCHVRSLVLATPLHERRLGFVVSALNARGNRLPGATTARRGLTPTALAPRRGRVRS